MQVEFFFNCQKQYLLTLSVINNTTNDTSELVGIILLQFASVMRMGQPFKLCMS